MKYLYSVLHGFSRENKVLQPFEKKRTAGFRFPIGLVFGPSTLLEADGLSQHYRRICAPGDLQNYVSVRSDRSAFSHFWQLKLLHALLPCTRAISLTTGRKTVCSLFFLKVNLIESR